MISSAILRRCILILSFFTSICGLVNSTEESNSTQIVVGPHRRHHHDKLALRNPAEPLVERYDQSQIKQGIIASGVGQGTFYYDVLGGGGACGPINGVFQFAETDGFGMCEYFTDPRSLRQRGSNKVVAISASRLGGNLANWCGKEVVIDYNGKTLGGFVLWDGCVSCDTTGGIDFSSTEFGNVVGQSNCGLGRVNGVRWEITEHQLWDYPSGNPINTPQQSQQLPKVETKPSLKPESKPDPKPEPKPSTSSTNPVKSAERPVEQPQHKPTTSSTVSTMSAMRSSSLFVDDNNPRMKPSISVVLSAMTRTRTRTHNRGHCTRKSTRSSELAISHQFLAAANTGVAQPSSSSCSAGAWRCVENTLQQCIQGAAWYWQTRVVCGSAPINCDSPNPVCTDITSGQ